MEVMAELKAQIEMACQSQIDQASRHINSLPVGSKIDWNVICHDYFNGSYATLWASSDDLPHRQRQAQ